VTGELTFLPHLRRGMAAAASTPDPLAGPFPAPVTAEAWVSVEGRRVTRTVMLEGAGEVTGLGTGQVVRCEPQPGSTDVEPNYFALCEVAAPDLPWMMTPAAPGQNERLRPWLVLVVVRRQEGVSVAGRSTTDLAVLTIEPPATVAAELPDLADSWAWAHVQASVPTDQIGATVATGGSGVLARFLCPRRLVAGTAYYACLVPAVDAAVARGLGGQPATESLEPAWDLAAPPERIELPVYHWWEFATGETGDFESLCRRLQPDTGEAVMGLHAMDVRDPGLVTPAARPVIVDLEGALMTLGASPRRWPSDHRDRFTAEIEPVLDAAIATPITAVAEPGRYDPAVDDPVLTPPAYGAWPSAVTELPDSGWVRGVNVSPVRRAMAGLGAAVVRANQEALVAAAWDQAGDLRAAASLVNQARLAAEIGESWARRARSLPDADVLQLTRVLHPVLDDGDRSVRSSVLASGAPAGLFSASYLRRTRPGSTLWRDWRRLAGDDARLAANHAGTVLAATRAGSDSSLRVALAFADYVVPKGTQCVDPTLRSAPATSRPARSRTVPGVPGTPGGPVIPGIPRPTASPAAAVRADLVPHRAVRTSLVARVPALDAVLAPGALPSALTVAPRFDDALYWDLLALGASWIVPGIELLGANRVRLLAVNTPFVGAFLIGANTEIARELRWRDYPIDLRATCFQRFFEYVADPDRTDITELSGWDTTASIVANMGGADVTMTAIVVRGDLVRRYPSAHWFLQPAQLAEEGWQPVDGAVVEISFLGALDAQTAVYGFDVDPDTVRGNRENGVGGYFVGVEERLGAPRFGLDPATRAHFTGTPRGWDEASWGHLVDSREALDALTHARATGLRLDGATLDGTTWGRNSAHMARATWQRPFRMLMHADLLI
jgi:hypothetical protein